ncbi:MAG TPA: hypothetical protein VJX67_11950, partial [Blastocatellia bacterium]|nr:hypothetical protein [Blastocatellia bacterium]
MRLTWIGSLIVLLGASASMAWAQNPIQPQRKQNQPVLGKAGTVNFVEGDAAFLRAGSDWTPVQAGNELQAGDQLRTGAQGRVEILLYPGAVLRVAGDTQCSFANLSSESLRMKIDAGSAIVEAPAPGKFNRTLATIGLPNADVTIVSAGVYRFDVATDRQAVAKVFSGKLDLGAKQVKEGRKATLAPGVKVVISKFDRAQLNSFDIWSRNRAALLLDGNALLADGALDGIDTSSLIDPCEGFWIFNPLVGAFVYVPNRDGDCSSLTSPYQWASSYGWASSYAWAYAECAYIPVYVPEVGVAGDNDYGRDHGDHGGGHHHHGDPDHDGNHDGDHHHHGDPDHDGDHHHHGDPDHDGDLANGGPTEPPAKNEKPAAREGNPAPQARIVITNTGARRVGLNTFGKGGRTVGLPANVRGNSSSGAYGYSIAKPANSGSPSSPHGSSSSSGASGASHSSGTTSQSSSGGTTRSSAASQSSGTSSSGSHSSGAGSSSSSASHSSGSTSSG